MFILVKCLNCKILTKSILPYYIQNILINLYIYIIYIYIYNIYIYYTGIVLYPIINPSSLVSVLTKLNHLCFLISSILYLSLAFVLSICRMKSFASSLRKIGNLKSPLKIFLYKVAVFGSYEY